MYNLMRGTKDKQKKTLNLFKKANKYFVVPLYRAGILSLFVGKVFVLLRTKGRRTGKTRYTPIEYRKRGDVIFLFSSRGEKGDWYRNLRAHPEDVRVKIGFKWYKPKIEVIEDVEENMRILQWYVDSFPKVAKGLFGWDKKKDEGKYERLRPIAEYIKIIKLTSLSRV